jgi:riboflavin synthase
MFTGIITAVGEVREITQVDGGRDLTVTAPWTDIEPGESIAVDGACLTVVRSGAGWFAVHIVVTSLERTVFGEYVAGRAVNLERALRAGDRLGGHLVQGHVDGTGSVVAVAQRDDARLIDITIPVAIAKASIPLGSIAINGVALTVNAKLSPDTIQVSLIPFTLQHTNLAELRVGDRVHVEGDTVGKYLQQLVEPWRGAGA